MNDSLSTPARNDWALTALHLLLAISIPLVLTFMLGCKKAVETKEDLGPALPPETIDKALTDAVQGVSLSNIAKGQYVDFIDTRKILNQDTTTTLGARDVQVIGQDDSSDHTTFTLLISETQRRADGTFTKPHVTEFPIRVSKVSLLEQQARALAESDAQPLRTTFHHLKVASGTMDPPDKVKSRPDCGGLHPCQLNVKFVSFDMVIWYSEKDYQKITIDLALSNQTPYLPYGDNLFSQLNGALVVNCQSTFVPVNGRHIYVRDCSSLDDFSLIKTP